MSIHHTFDCVRFVRFNLPSLLRFFEHVGPGDGFPFGIGDLHGLCHRFRLYSQRRGATISLFPFFL